jgi:hypothetical protein
VSDFTGPNTSVDVLLLNGQTIQTNRALRFSQTIDSDGDGVVNAFDVYPFDAAAWNTVPSTNGFWNSIVMTNAGGTPAVSLSWNATPQTVYQVEFATNLLPANWQPLLTYTNVAVTNGVIRVMDSGIPDGEQQRYYRVRYGP